MAVIAIDMGGTKIKGALLNKRLVVLKSLRIPTPVRKGKAGILASLELVISSLQANSKHKVTAIGISLPGIVDTSGRLIFAGTVLKSLAGMQLKDHLEKKFHLPIFIQNDANCFALAEAVFDAHASTNTILGVIWGSGVGAGVVKKNTKGTFELLDLPVEFGHNKIFDKKTNSYVSLESLAGGKFIEKLYKQKGGKLTSPTVGEIYASREKLAKDIIKTAIEQMGMALANLVNIFSPDEIVIGGGLSQFPKPVYVKLHAIIKKHALPICTKNLKIKPFSLTNDEGLYGAALLALKK